MEKITITLSEASELTGIGYLQIKEWAETDESFPAFKVGRKTMMETSMLKEWLRNRCKNRVGMESVKIMRIIRKRKKA